MTRQEVLTLRQIIEQSVQSLPDEISLKGITLHPRWEAGNVYAVGYKVRYGEKLFRCLQEHTAQADWTPDSTASLWSQICETHTGTVDDPIPYDGNMALTSGLYYIQDAVLYLCIRDTVNPVYHNLSELVGLYVEKV